MDYAEQDRDLNQQKYGSKYNIPDINLRDIKVPISVFGGSEDNMVVSKDIWWLYNNVPKVRYVSVINGMAHGHFNGGNGESGKRFIKKFMKRLKKYNPIDKKYKPGHPNVRASLDDLDIEDDLDD